MEWIASPDYVFCVINKSDSQMVLLNFISIYE